MSQYIPVKKELTLTNRQHRRQQEQAIKKLEKKFGKNLELPTEEDIKQYIEEKTGNKFLNLSTNG